MAKNKEDDGHHWNTKHVFFDSQSDQTLNEVAPEPVLVDNLDGVAPVPENVIQGAMKASFSWEDRPKFKKTKERFSDWYDGSSYTSTLSRFHSGSSPAEIMRLDMTEDQKLQNDEEIRKSIILKPMGSKTHITAVVIDSKEGKECTNRELSVPCNHGIAFVQGYAYDQAIDAYRVFGVEVANFGHIPVGYEITIPGTANWKTCLPMPPNVIDKHMSVAQKRLLTNLKERFPADRYSIEFVQMTGCDL